METLAHKEGRERFDVPAMVGRAAEPSGLPGLSWSCPPPQQSAATDARTRLAVRPSNGRRSRCTWVMMPDGRDMSRIGTKAGTATRREASSTTCGHPRAARSLRAPDARQHNRNGHLLCSLDAGAAAEETCSSPAAKLDRHEHYEYRNNKTQPFDYASNTLTRQAEDEPGALVFKLDRAAERRGLHRRAAPVAPTSRKSALRPGGTFGCSPSAPRTRSISCTRATSSRRMAACSVSTAAARCTTIDAAGTGSVTPRWPASAARPAATRVRRCSGLAASCSSAATPGAPAVIDITGGSSGGDADGSMTSQRRL